MFEALKGINIADPKFYIPVIIGVIILFIIVKVAKKILKVALFLALIALVALVYFNLPSLKVDGSEATLKISGHQYTIDTKDVKIKSLNVDGKNRVYLISDEGKPGETRIELPFSSDFAKRFILERINKAVNSELASGTGQTGG